jgi:hypothetical protein
MAKSLKVKILNTILFRPSDPQTLRLKQITDNRKPKHYGV